MAGRSASEVSGSKCLLLRHDEIDAVYVEPFILTGYRRPGLSWWQCMKHTLVLHNDVGNFWTHFVPFVLWVWWLMVLAREENFFQPYNYPMLCFWVGACSYALFSSIAHMFSCKSFLVRTVCFIMDYLGIAMYALGADIGALFYLSAASSPLLRHRNLVLCVEVTMAVVATLLSGISRFYWMDYRFFIRAASYVIPYCFAIGPYLHRLWQCYAHGTDCVPETFVWHMLAVLFINLLVFFFVTKIPERFYPGRFDYIFQSHQLFHVCAACLTTTQMYYLPKEMAVRRRALSVVDGGLPSWQTTLLPFLCALVLGLGVVGGLAYLTKVGVLTSNKVERHKTH